jgi:hypothetical protein
MPSPQLLKTLLCSITQFLMRSPLFEHELHLNERLCVAQLRYSLRYCKHGTQGCWSSSGRERTI